MKRKSISKIIAKTLGVGISCALLGTQTSCSNMPSNNSVKKSRPNIIYFFSDEQSSVFWSGGGNKDIYTPNLERLAERGMVFNNCISNAPICVPYRNILINGHMINNQNIIRNKPDPLETIKYKSYPQVLKEADYQTGYVGKLHLDNINLSPEDRRYGYDWWRQSKNDNNVLNTQYWIQETNSWGTYEGYAPTGQMTHALEFIEGCVTNNPGKPFLLTLSMLPPHPVNKDGQFAHADAPEKWVNYYKDKEITFRENVPQKSRTENSKKNTKMYYAHISALDEELGRLLYKLDQLGIEDNTLIIYTSDHGDMLYSQGRGGKSVPYEESICVPFIVSWPGHIPEGAISDTLLSTIDIAPSILSLAGLKNYIPSTMNGMDLSHVMLGKPGPEPEAVFITAASMTWYKGSGGNDWEWRGVRTAKYTYATSNPTPDMLQNYNLLFDNETDPYQMNNLYGNEQYKDIQCRLEKRLKDLEKRYGLKSFD